MYASYSVAAPDSALVPAPDSAVVTAPAPISVRSAAPDSKKKDLISLAAEARTVTEEIRNNFKVDDDSIWIVENEKFDGDGEFYAISERRLEGYKLKPYDPLKKVRGMKVVLLEDFILPKCTKCFMERDHYTEDCPNIKNNGEIDFSYKAKLWCLICGQRGQHYTGNCPHCPYRGPKPCICCGVMDDAPNHDNILCVLKYDLKIKKEMREAMKRVPRRPFKSPIKKKKVLKKVVKEDNEVNAMVNLKIT